MAGALRGGTGIAPAEAHTAVPSSQTASLRELALRGSALILLGTTSRHALRLAGNLVLTRLLFPEAFGLLTLVYVFLTGLQMLSDVGIRPSIVQNAQGDDPDFLNTAWTLQIARGGALWLIAAVLATPVAAFYAEPQLAQLIPAAGVSAVLMGFASTKLHTAGRHLVLGRLTLIELFSYVVGLSVMILLAWTWRSVWALVWGAIADALCTMVLSHAALPGSRNRLCWNRGCARSIFRFGKWIFFSSVVTYLTTQGDRLILGKLLSAAQLGVYGVALVLSQAASLVFSQLTHRVWFPSFSRKAAAGAESLASTYYQVRWRQDMVALAAAGFLFAAGAPLIELLYDTRYHEAGWMLRILAIQLVLGPAQGVGTACLTAMGHPQVATAASAVRGVFLWASVPLGYGLGGVTGVVWAVGLNAVVGLPVTYWGLRKYGILIPRRELLGAPGLILGYFAGRAFAALAVS